jgi:hypothetical protein
MNSKSRKLKESDKKVIASSQAWKCKKCDNILSATYQIDHIIPFSITFDDSYSNLQALCVNCHSQKSQTESNRINQFKKKQSLSTKKLCWFCVNEIDDFHKCDKVLHDIVKNSTRNINEFNKFIYFEKSFDTTLHLRLLPNIVGINNYFTDATGDYSVDRLVEIINMYLSISKNIVKFSKVEVDLSEMHPDEEIPNELIDHLHEYLPVKIPKEVFDPKVDIEYSYII